MATSILHWARASIGLCWFWFIEKHFFVLLSVFVLPKKLTNRYHRTEEESEREREIDLFVSRKSQCLFIYTPKLFGWNSNRIFYTLNIYRWIKQTIVSALFIRYGRSLALFFSPSMSFFLFLSENLCVFVCTIDKVKKNLFFLLLSTENLFWSRMLANVEMELKF